MKIKILLLLLICIALGILVNKQNELIKVQKDERQLIKISEEIVKSKVSVVSDGDSFIMTNGNIIRLFGIDAPELGQICINKIENTDKNGNVTIKEESVKCGEIAKNRLANLIENNEIECTVKGKDAYERLVCECGFERYNTKTKRRDKININKEMVISGNAIAFQQISDKYVEDENRAKAENRGIWATTFDMPSVYRKKNTK